MKAGVEMRFAAGNVKICQCVCLMSKDGKILMTKRSRDAKVSPGAWICPGGRLKPQETLEQGICRKVKDEVGLEILEHQPKPFLMLEDNSDNVIKPADVEPIPNQILMLFHRAQLDQDSSEIVLKPNDNKVEATAWLSLDQI